MRAWYDILGSELVRREDEAGLRQSLARSKALLAREKERGIAAGRIVLAGFSQGCAMALLDRTAAWGAAGGHRGHVGLPAAGGHDRRRTQPGQCAHARLPGPRHLRQRGAARSAAQQSRDAAAVAGLRRRAGTTYPMAHSVCLEEIRDLERLAGEGAGQGLSVRCRLGAPLSPPLQGSRNGVTFASLRPSRARPTPSMTRLQDALTTPGAERLQGIRRGIEKESLRATPAGALALTPHPQALGLGADASAHHHRLQRVAARADHRRACHARDLPRGAAAASTSSPYRALGDEMLWVSSMPCTAAGRRDDPDRPLRLVQRRPRQERLPHGPGAPLRPAHADHLGHPLQLVAAGRRQRRSTSR